MEFALIVQDQSPYFMIVGKSSFIVNAEFNLFPSVLFHRFVEADLCVVVNRNKKQHAVI